MLEILKARFQDNKNLHMELSWLDVEKRLLEHPGSMDVLRRMEESGGFVLFRARVQRLYSYINHRIV